MVTNVQEAIDWIHSKLKFGVKPGIDRMNYILDRLGNPHQKSKYVHIAGTNGKGSTLTFLNEIVQSANYSVGTFTSPYIEYFNERISVNGRMISDDELVTLVNIVAPIVDEMKHAELGEATEFEIITAMMFYFFAELNPVDLVIVETGLGGLYDSTNVIKPIISIITNIGFDHTDILGDTIEEICRQKAGIIKNEVPVVTAVENQEALNVIEKQATLTLSSLYTLHKRVTVACKSGNL
ncbi:Mur ligase family protein [Bacillus carboniphilus]|uniref:Mur ligase family protein n=1 Tax=Bacillus carboniphilus TaxID=86663 RepID=A0ABY9JXH3_9BACI|nr:Mur ligase family protein [Bacillus carboniphilus]WLR44092.1 Mur ligase family protein [Bacillus carboniphilus]